MKMLRFDNFRLLKAFFGVLAVASLAVPIILFYHHRSLPIENNHKNISRKQHPRSRHVIHGFSFTSNQEGTRTILIKADRFSIEKKKLAYFRFGLMNEAILENARVHLYGKRETSKPKSGDRQNLSFNALFSKKSLPSFSTKRISSIVMKPVQIKLYDEQSEVSRISSSKAIIRLKKRNILFTGNVRMVSSSRVLTTDELCMYPDGAVIKTDRPFVLKTPEKQWKGRSLTTDIFLTQGIS